ncbi:DNA-binding protein SMUBP-2-like [Centruroides vittatus]|uniref:DNA-binding protein SMUBP-2-like n=1 Tax=Centruroides vittatus TaxID=120091 RepID=UPI00350F3B9E
MQIIFSRFCSSPSKLFNSKNAIHLLINRKFNWNCQMAVDKFVSKHLELLNIERDAEVEQSQCMQTSISLANLQRKGICISKLRLGSCHTGLFGRSICVFEPFTPGKTFEAHGFTAGDIVGIITSGSDDNRETIASGVVSRVSQANISVSFEEKFDSLGIEDDVQYHICKLANEVTYRRMKRALLNLKDNVNSYQLISVLFNECKPCDNSQILNKELVFFNDKLDNCQKEAVKFSLSQKEIAIIHGPPGTGKTTTLIEIILQFIKNGLKVLVCAPSNIAVDNLVEKLAVHKAKIVRLGHPARLLFDIQQYSLDAILSRSEENEIVNDLRNEIDMLRRRNKQSKSKIQQEIAGKEVRSLQKELREREKVAVQRILKRADVILSTLTSASDDGPLKHIPPEHFDVVVIDECSQAIEAACWIPLLNAPKCVLAGDHQQLPPTIVSERAAKEGLSVSLMERLVNLYGETITRMLFIQYRMHEDIMAWPSSKMYENKLIAHSSVAQHLLKDMNGIEVTEETSTPLLLIDTAGCQLYELELEEEESKGNEGEADLVTIHVEKLIKSGIKPEDIAVITPYNLQVDLLRLRLISKYPTLEIKSVDGFQGREKEAVVLSFVRSNTKGEVGFLAEDRRINVAITRARRHLAVICDSETVSNHQFLKSFVEYLNSEGDVQTAHQYENELGKFDVNRPEHLQFKKVQSSVEKSKCNKKQNTQVKSKKEKITNQTSEKEKENISSSLKGPEVDEERQTIENEMQMKINAFLQSEENILSFPTTLSSYERRIIHELAERIGLIHSSHGEGSDRYIVLSKHEDSIVNVDDSFTKDKDENENVENLSSEIIDNSAESEENCPICNKMIPKNNLKLHLFRCKPVVQDKPKDKCKTQKLKLRPKFEKKESDINIDEDIDTLLTEIKKADSTCFFTKCKTNITVLSQRCQFCGNNFCLSHHMPEIHGCGDAARSHARSQIRKQGKLYSGSGVPSKKSDPTTRAHLQKKLDKKLSEMSQQRKTKKK